MPKKRFVFGVIDPITIIGVLFLIITLSVGTYVVSDKKYNFNIFEKAGNLSPWDGEEGINNWVNPNPPDNDSSNSGPIDDSLEDEEIEYIYESTGAQPISNNPLPPPAPNPEPEEPAAPISPAVPPPTQPTSGGGCYLDENTTLPEGVVVVYSSGDNNYKYCGSDGRWTSTCPDGQECELADVTQRLQPVYLEPQYQEAVDARLEQERESCASGILLNGQCATVTQHTEIVDLSRFREDPVTNLVTTLTNSSGDVSTSRLSVEQRVETVDLSRFREDPVTNLVTEYRDTKGNLIVRDVAPLIQQTYSTVGRGNVAYIVDTIRNGNTNEILNSLTRSFNTQIAQPTVNNTPIYNFAYCSKDGASASEIAECNQNMSKIYNSPIVGNYIQAYAPQNYQTNYELYGYKSVEDCLLNKEFGKDQCYGSQLTKDQATSSIDLGTDIASVITLPIAPAYFGTKSLLMLGLGTFGGTMTVQQSKNAVIAQIEDPGFFKAQEDINPDTFWEKIDPQTYLTNAGYQTTMAGLGWLNLSSADKLMRAWGPAGNAITQQSARIYNTAVSAANLYVDAPYAYNTCTQDEFSLGDCAFAGGVLATDIIFGGLDYYQGQLTLNPIRAVTETIDSIAPSLVNVNRLANNPLNEFNIPTRSTTEINIPNGFVQDINPLTNMPIVRADIQPEMNFGLADPGLLVSRSLQPPERFANTDELALVADLEARSRPVDMLFAPALPPEREIFRILTTDAQRNFASIDIYNLPGRNPIKDGSNTYAIEIITKPIADFIANNVVSPFVSRYLWNVDPDPNLQRTVSYTKNSVIPVEQNPVTAWWNDEVAKLNPNAFDQVNEGFSNFWQNKVYSRTDGFLPRWTNVGTNPIANAIFGNPRNILADLPTPTTKISDVWNKITGKQKPQIIEIIPIGRDYQSYFFRGPINGLTSGKQGEVIIYSDGKITFRDTGSLNGTFYKYVNNDNFVKLDTNEEIDLYPSLNAKELIAGGEEGINLSYIIYHDGQGNVLLTDKLGLNGEVTISSNGIIIKPTVFDRINTTWQEKIATPFRILINDLANWGGEPAKIDISEFTLINPRSSLLDVPPEVRRVLYEAEAKSIPVYTLPIEKLSKNSSVSTSLGYSSAGRTAGKANFPKSGSITIAEEVLLNPRYPISDKVRVVAHEIGHIEGPQIDYTTGSRFNKTIGKIINEILAQREASLALTRVGINPPNGFPASITRFVDTYRQYTGRNPWVVLDAILGTYRSPATDKNVIEEIIDLLTFRREDIINFPNLPKNIIIHNDVVDTLLKYGVDTRNMTPAEIDVIIKALNNDLENIKLNPNVIPVKIQAVRQPQTSLSPSAGVLDGVKKGWDNFVESNWNPLNWIGGGSPMRDPVADTPVISKTGKSQTESLPRKIIKGALVGISGSVGIMATTINFDRIENFILDKLHYGYFAPTLNTWVYYKNGNWYREDNNELIPRDAQFLYLLDPTIITPNTIDNKIIDSVIPQYITIDTNTFNSPEWIKIESEIKRATIEQGDLYNIYAITDAVYNQLKPKANNLTNMWDANAYYFFGKDLEDRIKRDNIICFEFTTTEQAYLASIGIKAEMIAGLIGGEIDGGHSFLRIYNGTFWAVDPTFNVVKPYDEYIKDYGFTDIKILDYPYELVNFGANPSFNK